MRKRNSDNRFKKWELDICKLFQVLAQGSSPLAYLSDHIEKYVACVMGKTKEGCDVILRPPKKRNGKKTADAPRWQNIPKPILHYI